MIGTRNAVVAACGVSAGVHVALFPTHLGESPALAASFGAAAFLLAAAAAALVVRPESVLPAGVASVLFAGLLVAYAVLRHEPFDAVAGGTKLVEAAGLVLSLRMLRVPLATPTKSTAVGVFALCLAFGLMLGGHAHA